MSSLLKKPGYYQSENHYYSLLLNFIVCIILPF